MGIIKTVIVDDEKNGREFLKGIILRHTPALKIVGEAHSVATAEAVIKDAEPDLVLLDIELADGSGFDLLTRFPEPFFRVVFVTGYDQYAIRAFKHSAIDYLLKPVHIPEFITAIEKVQDMLLPDLERLNFLKQQLNRPADGVLRQIVIHHHKGYNFLKLDDVVKLEAAGSYVYFHLCDGSKTLASHSLGYYEEILPENVFFRAHKSFVVNLSKVQRYESGRGGILVLSDNSRVEVAQRRKPLLVEYLKLYNQAS